MARDIQATIVHIDSTDIMSASNRLEELHQRLAEKERAAEKARKDLEEFEASTRACLQRHPELLAEFDAECTELSRRRTEREARTSRVNELRKKNLTIKH